MMNYKVTVLSVWLLSVVMPLMGGVSKVAPLVSIKEKNKQADTAFIQWRRDADYSPMSQELRTLLTPVAITFLVDQSQLSFTRIVSKKELLKKVNMVSLRFLEKFNPGGTIKINRSEFDTLIKEVIIPEYVFQVDSTLQDRLDKAYNELLQTLRQYKTAAGTYLNLWALRFLTSEAQFVALSIIKRDTLAGKIFNQLEVPDKIEVLTTAGKIITRRFMNNLESAQKEFGFSVPAHSQMAVKQRVDRFLKEKFGL